LAGIGVDNMFFEKTTVTITNHLKPLEFKNLADTNHFNKYKLVNAFAELPLELRFVLNPENTNKSFKVASVQKWVYKWQLVKKERVERQKWSHCYRV
jgi:hypothetical protein